jgi:acetylornithine deacetylase
MKSGCAAMVELFLVMAEVLPEEERPCVALLLVVGEEEDGDGTAAYLKQEVIPPVVIIGEPTALAVCFRHYGYLEIGLETGGRRIHSSLPEMGSNAVESMLKFLLLLSSEPLFVKEDTGVVYSIREMSSSRRGFVVPDRCEAWIDVHIPPDKEYDSVITRVRELEEIAKNETENLDLTLNFQVNAAGYELPVKGPVPRMLSESYEELGLPLLFETFRSHSDGNLFFQKDVQPIILGPGSLETAHTSDEHVRFDQVITATRIYAALALTKFPENK